MHNQKYNIFILHLDKCVIIKSIGEIIMQKRLELEIEFNENNTLDDIYEELMNYKNNGIIATCKYHQIILSNANEQLKSLIEKLKLNLSDDEYKEYAIEKTILQSMKSTSKIVKYYIERGASFIEDESQQESFKLECYYNYSQNKEYFKVIKIAAKLLEALHNQRYIQGYDANKDIENVMDSLTIEDELLLNTAEMLICRFVLDGDIRRLNNLLQYSYEETAEKLYAQKLELKYPIVNK